MSCNLAPMSKPKIWLSTIFLNLMLAFQSLILKVTALSQLIIDS